MAGNLAWQAGKGAFQKFNGKTSHQDPTIRSVDNAHYRGARVEKKKEDGKPIFFLNDDKIGNHHRKDTAYYEYLGIPEKDAMILSRVVQNARFLDNGIHVPVVGYKIGVNTFVELIPGLGDIAGTGLSFALVVLPAFFVSEGPNKGSDRRKLRRVLVFNLSKDGLIGLLPLLGDWIDTMKKYNVRNADALETMLLKRVDHAAKMGRDAEKIGRTTGHQHAGTNGQHRAANGRYHRSEPSSDPPPRYVTANDLRDDPRSAATGRPLVAQTQEKKSGGNFFRRRGGPQDNQEVGTTVEDAPPVRPSRSQQSKYGPGGHF